MTEYVQRKSAGNSNASGTLGLIKTVSREILAERRRKSKAARPALDPLPMTPGQRALRERARALARLRAALRKTAT